MREALAVSALLACLGGAPPLQAQESAPSELRFAWPVPVEFEVVETTHKGPRSAQVRHRVALTRAGRELRLRFRELTPLRLNGHELAGAKLSAELRAQLGRLPSFLPDLRVAPSGESLGVSGLEAALERWVQGRRELSPELSADELKQARARMLAPEYRAMVEGKAQEFWHAWVGAWAGLRLAKGDQVRGTTAIPIAGRQVEATTLLMHLGQADGRTHLAQEIHLSGEAARAACEAMLRRLAADAAEADPPRVLSFERQTRIEVLTEASTLQPKLCAVEQTTILQVAGEEARTQRERREYRFAWPAPAPQTGPRPGGRLGE